MCRRLQQEGTKKRHQRVPSVCRCLQQEGTRKRRQCVPSVCRLSPAAGRHLVFSFQLQFFGFKYTANIESLCAFVEILACHSTALKRAHHSPIRWRKMSMKTPHPSPPPLPRRHGHPQHRVCRPTVRHSAITMEKILSIRKKSCGLRSDIAEYGTGIRAP